MTKNCRYATINSKHYKNWYSIKTDDGLNRSNVVIVGKKQLLKVALALIVMALFNKNTTINKFKTN